MGYVGVRVDTEDPSLLDWRVLLLTLAAFVLGASFCLLIIRARHPHSQQPPAPPAMVGVALGQPQPKPPPGPLPSNPMPPNWLTRHTSGSKGFGDFQHKMPSEREEAWLPVLVP